MSFNFAAFMAALNKVLPVVAEVVESLHPGNVTEATKINTGVALVAALTQALQDAHTQSNVIPVSTTVTATSTTTQQ